MNKIIILGFAIFSIFALTACKTITATESMPQSVQFSGSDLVIGEVLTAELPYKEDANMKEELIAKALKGTNYDILVAPKFEVIEKALSRPVMRVTGKGARIK